MGALAVLVLILAMAGRSSASYCLCKQGDDAALQKVLDWACGNGADCTQIAPNGPCYNPDNVRAHCSYAVNSYFYQKSATGGTCSFNGAAYLTATDPSTNGCTYPAVAGSAGSTTNVPSTSPSTPGSVTPVSGSTPTGTSSSSPYSTTPGVLGGGIGTGLAPSGMGMTDSHGIELRGSSILIALLVAAISSSSLFLLS